MTIIDDRLAELDAYTLNAGGHSTFADGHCAMELTSWLAGEPFSDHPQCVAPVLTSFVQRLNDRWDDDQRQQLKPFLPRLIGTATDGISDQARAYIASDWALRVITPKWLDAAGMTDDAAALRNLAPVTSKGSLAAGREVARPISDRAWKKRVQWRKHLQAEIERRLKDQPADVAAVAAAAAAVDVAAAAAVDVDVAAAAAVDVAAAAAVDVAAAVAAAAAAAAAAAVAADADAVVPGYGTDEYWAWRNNLYDTVYKQVRERMGDVHGDLIAWTNQSALDCLKNMINGGA